ncbi:MAG: hypothetical protein M3518_04435 [Actinomycetota bacterium]|nr:hypothetical protein [Actinomycetota bacterium]
MEHEPAWEPIPKVLEQPTLPFEQSAPKSGDDEPTEAEIEPREVWKALSAAMKATVRRDCLRTMREVLGNDPE